MKVLILLCTLITAITSENSTRIVGGFQATQGQFKHQASLQRAGDYFHFCGGSVISRRSILTAAHCKVPSIALQQMRVLVGSNDVRDPRAQRLRVESFLVHRQYNPSYTLNDIAVVVVQGQIEFNELVMPINLVNRVVHPGERLIASGWGYTKYPYPPEGPPRHLKWLRTNLISRRQCQPYSQSLLGKLCVLESVGNGVCSGDSGGPLIDNQNQLVGVASSAFLCATGRPDFFTDVFYQRNWILQNSP